jgi:hypothetical protein
MSNSTFLIHTPCRHDFQTFVFNHTKNIHEFMCLICGHSASDEYYFNRYNKVAPYPTIKREFDDEKEDYCFC